MVDKKLIALSLICIVLSIGLIESVIMLNQKETELQTKNDQVSILENEKFSLEAHVATLQFNISGLHSEIASLTNDKNALEAQVASFQSEVTSLTNEKTALENQVSNLQTEAATLEDEKTTLEMQISSLQANISSFQSEVTSLTNEKTALENQVSNLQTKVTSLENEVIESFDLGYAEGEAEGYQLGYDEGYAQGVEDLTQNGWYLTDPTYDEAIAFIDSDTTDENDYTPDYVCYDFTADFDSNAAQAGYRCGFVYIEFFDSAHAIVCFNTTDEGLVYIEPQNDEIVDVAVGQSYLGEIVVKMGIIW